MERVHERGVGAKVKGNVKRHHLPGIPQCFCAVLLRQSEKLCRFKLDRKMHASVRLYFSEAMVRCDSQQEHHGGLMQGTATRSQ